MSTKLPTVAIIGRANAGKSSLFNRLVKSQQAIVAREAGTTRDNVVGKVTYLRRNADRQYANGVNGKAQSESSQASTVEPQLQPLHSEDSDFPSEFDQDQTADSGRTYLKGARGADGTSSKNNSSQFWLVDTAGMKSPDDEFEATIQEQITEAVAAADVIIVAADSTEFPDDELRRVAKSALRSKKPVLLAVNKVDLKGSLDSDEFRRLGIRDIVRTSTEHNIGISELLDWVGEHVPAANERDAGDVLRIALIGRPNVGKSTLFNSLAGKQQAITANVAGTTRDLNRLEMRFNQRTIELIDTAGVRRPGKVEVGIEKFSVLRTLQAIEDADICYLLMDASELNTGLDQRLAGLIDEAGKGLVLVVSKWDAVEGKDAYTRDALAPKIARNFDFVPWAPLIFTSAITGQNVTKLFDLALDIDARRHQEIKTRQLNTLLQDAIQKHPPAGLKNTHPRLRYMVQTDVAPPWFVIYGSHLKFVHWSYKRYLERLVREQFDFGGTPIRFSFRDEIQIKSNKDRIARGLEPVTEASKAAKNAAKLSPDNG